MAMKAPPTSPRQPTILLHRGPWRRRAGADGGPPLHRSRRQPEISRLPSFLPQRRQRRGNGREAAWPRRHHRDRAVRTGSDQQQAGLLRRPVRQPDRARRGAAVSGALLIVGAGPGIGLATAERFGREGWTIVLAARNSRSLGPMVARLVGAGINAHALVVDATDPAALQAGLRTANRMSGGLTAVLYNAARLRQQDLLSMSEPTSSATSRSTSGALHTIRAAERPRRAHDPRDDAPPAPHADWASLGGRRGDPQWPAPRLRPETGSPPRPSRPCRAKFGRSGGRRRDALAAAPTRPPAGNAATPPPDLRTATHDHAMPARRLSGAGQSNERRFRQHRRPR